MLFDEKRASCELPETAFPISSTHAPYISKFQVVYPIHNTETQLCGKF